MEDGVGDLAVGSGHGRNLGLPTRSFRVGAEQLATSRRGIAAARAVLAACRRDPFPEITARHEVDRVLAGTEQGR
jgi:hypothetical protein